MRTVRLCLCAASTVLLLSTFPARIAAHSSLDIQIARLSETIGQRPEDAELYLRRGELHRLARDWNAATADYDRAAGLEPRLAEPELCRGALALDRNDAATAVRHLNTFLAARPNHPQALWLRSRALRAVGRLAPAVADMDRAIALDPHGRPEHYLERARALADASQPRIDAALRGLDTGITRLGPIVSLVQYAGELRRAAGLQPVGGANTAAGASSLAPSATSAPAVHRVAAAPARTTAVTLTRAPYLQRATPTSIVVRWRTGTAVDSRVRYGSLPTALSSGVTDGALVTEHEVTLTGLAPNTRYYYQIGTSTEHLTAADYLHFFTTAPAPGASKPTRVWVLGDSGLPGSQQNAVRDAYAAFTGPRVTDVWLMLGDNAYNSGTDAEYQAGLFAPYKAMLAKCVLWPTRGNHDAVFAGDNNDYYDLFTMPAAGQAGGVASGTEAYYSFDHGNIHFVCLDSEGSDRSSNGAMLTWLRADLTANQRHWTIAYWHHPPYTKGSHNSDDVGDSGGRMRDMRANALPILDSLGVDLVLTGHSHSYERSFLLDRHYGVSTTLVPSMILDAGSGNPTSDGPYGKATLGPAWHEGAVHAVAGSGSHTSGGTLNHPAMFTSLNVLGSMVLDIDGPLLLGRFVDGAGLVRDYFAIQKASGSTTDVEASVRVDLRLDPAWPNPSAGATRIGYSLPASGSVRLTVHDAAGRRIATILDGRRPEGRHTAVWDGRDGYGRRVAAGVYFARLEFAGAMRQGKVVLSR